MMLFLRALVILGAVLAVVSCGFARWRCLKSWATVPAAGSTGCASIAGQCL